MKYIKFFALFLMMSGLILPVHGMTLTREESYSVSLSRDVQYCYDDTLPEGTEKILTDGSDGELLCTARVTYDDGVELGRQVLCEQALSLPQTRVVALGSAPAREDPEKPVITDSTITLPGGEVLTYYKVGQARASAYTHTDAGCDMVTSTGTTVRRGTVAVDPNVIPYGTRMYIMASDGSYIYGLAQAEDCGGAIRGDRMDLYMESYEACMAFGRRKCTLYFLG